MRQNIYIIINNKYLQISPKPVQTTQEVILEYRAIDSNTIHPAYRNWIQRYTLACAKGILGQVRGKYTSLPSPAGGAQLNGAALLQESQAEKQALIEELVGEIEMPPCFTAF